MGTGCRGLYLNTYGSTTASTKQSSVYAKNPGKPITMISLNHANSGEYQRNGRMTGGGHGEDSFAELKARGQKYIIEHEYENGVREGRIPNHVKSFERNGKHMWFPKTWTKRTLYEAGQSVVKSDENVNITNGVATGKYLDVDVGVRLRDGEIVTIYQLLTQSSKHIN